jgi:RNA polymerase sigma-70 factor (ECF subfamily)
MVHEMKDDLDRFLVERVQEGDTSAFGELVEKYQKRIYELAYGFTHHPEDAHDLSQEIFFKAFKALKRFKGDSSFYTWLYRIARNAGIDHTRRKAGRINISFEEAFPPDDSQYYPRCDSNSVPYRLEQDELGIEIEKAIQQLSPRQKQVFVLRHYEDLSLREIADLLNLRIGSIKAHLFSATRKLRKLLTPYLEE